MCGSVVDIQSAATEIRRGIKTRIWADAQRDGPPAEYRWPLCKSSVIPVLVPRRKVWSTPAAGVPCSNTANIGECKTWTQSEFCMWRNPVRGQQPPKCTYSIAAQKMAKHRAKFGWPPVNVVTAVTKPSQDAKF